jgi:hypothetical protein
VLIATVARLGYLGGPDSTVLDMTYGRGSFWTRYRPAGLLTNDLHTSGVDARFDFREMPLRDASVPVALFDPPYISTGNRETSSVDDLYDRFGLGELKGWRAIRALIDAGLAECERALAPRGYLLVKCMDYVESGRNVHQVRRVGGRRLLCGCSCNGPRLVACGGFAEDPGGGVHA